MTMQSGTIAVCPGCGASLQAFELRCSLCGQEFTGTKNSDAVTGLVDRLADIDREFSGKVATAKKIEAIRNWPIPVNTTDLLEFATIAGGNAVVGVGAATGLTDAWRAKALEVVAKGKLAFKEGDRGLAVITELQQKLTSDQRTRAAVGASKGVFKIVVLVAVLGVLVFGGLLVAVSMM